MKIKTKIIASSIAAIMLCTGSLAFAESKDYTDVNKQLLSKIPNTQSPQGLSLPKIVSSPQTRYSQ